MICINQNYNSGILHEQLREKNIKIDCSDDWHKYQKKINTKNNICVDDCNQTDYNFEYKGKCFKKCTKDHPFLKIISSSCVKNCDINDIIKENCLLTYDEEEELYFKPNEILSNIFYNLRNNDKTILFSDENEMINFNTDNVNFEILKLKFLNMSVIKNKINNSSYLCNSCESLINENNISIYLLTIIISDTHNSINFSL